MTTPSTSKIERHYVEEMLEKRHVDGDYIQELLGEQQTFTRNEVLEMIKNVTSYSLDEEIENEQIGEAYRKMESELSAKSEEKKERVRHQLQDENLDPDTQEDIFKDKTA